jgi:hypothetical protein
MKKMSALIFLALSTGFLVGCGAQEVETTSSYFEQAEGAEGYLLREEVIEALNSAKDTMLKSGLSETSFYSSMQLENSYKMTMVYDSDNPSEQAIYNHSDGNVYKAFAVNDFFIVKLYNFMNSPLDVIPNLKYEKRVLPDSTVEYTITEKLGKEYYSIWNVTLQSGLVVKGKYSESSQVDYPEERLIITYEFKYYLTEEEKGYIEKGLILDF